MVAHAVKYTKLKDVLCHELVLYLYHFIADITDMGSSYFLSVLAILRHRLKIRGLVCSQLPVFPSFPNLA